MQTTTKVLQTYNTTFDSVYKNTVLEGCLKQHSTPTHAVLVSQHAPRALFIVRICSSAFWIKYGGVVQMQRHLKMVLGI